MSGSIQIRKRFGDRQIQQHTCGEVEFLSFPSLERTGIVSHLISTRVGGVSEGIFSTMNLSFTRGDRKEHVEENYRRIAGILGCSSDDIVATQQTHTVNIRKVTASDRGKGVTRERDYTDIDGLITDEPGIALAVFTADCVPVFFVDPVHKAIGVAHSGWRGTAGRIGEHMVKLMGEEYGTVPKDLFTAIGPSICRDCYEVSEDVAEVFRKEFADDADLIDELIRTERYKWAEGPTALIVPGREAGKYQLDLWLANMAVLRRAGVPAEQIAVTDVCTCCNPDYLFSHRASQGKRGNLGAFLMLKEFKE